MVAGRRIDRGRIERRRSMGPGTTRTAHHCRTRCAQREPKDSGSGDERMSERTRAVKSADTGRRGRVSSTWFNANSSSRHLASAGRLERASSRRHRAASAAGNRRRATSSNQSSRRGWPSGWLGMGWELGSMACRPWDKTGPCAKLRPKASGGRPQPVQSGPPGGVQRRIPRLTMRKTLPKVVTQPSDGFPDGTDARTPSRPAQIRLVDRGIGRAGWRGVSPVGQ